jgi:hypothetical protein
MVDPGPLIIVQLPCSDTWSSAVRAMQFRRVAAKIVGFKNFVSGEIFESSLPLLTSAE